MRIERARGEKRERREEQQSSTVQSEKRAHLTEGGILSFLLKVITSLSSPPPSSLYQQSGLEEADVSFGVLSLSASLNVWVLLARPCLPFCFLLLIFSSSLLLLLLFLRHTAQGFSSTCSHRCCVRIPKSWGIFGKKIGVWMFVGCVCLQSRWFPRHRFGIVGGLNRRLSVDVSRLFSVLYCNRKSELTPIFNQNRSYRF